MILTGKEIINEYNNKNIFISPFSDKQVNPNSYNYRIGDSLKVYLKSDNGRPIFEIIQIPDEGYVLEPDKMYLSRTFEIIGSKKYAMSLIGRSSLGRLGLFLQISANLGHTTSQHNWTLELVACKKIRIYKNMIIGQVSFWRNNGDVSGYEGFFGGINNIQESNI